MNIALVQCRSVRGDIPANIVHHINLIQQAAAHGADLIIFPELSLTGYEPELAQSLAMTLDAPRLDVFQQFADKHRIIIGLGVPLATEHLSTISLVLFQPDAPRSSYTKQYLHQDEVPYFSCGSLSSGILGTNPKIALAICYELSVPEHALAAVRNRAQIYIASVAKSQSGVESAYRRLQEIARTGSMTVMMVNNIGACDNFIGAGQSAVWDSAGQRIAQLDAESEGILLYDTTSKKTSCV